MKQDETSTKTQTASEYFEAWGGETPLAGLLVAFAPINSVSIDRFRIPKSLIIGRGDDCDLTVIDKKISKRHLLITCNEQGYWVEDLKSTNGTIVNGRPLRDKQALDDQAVIRIGQVILVFHRDAASLLAPSAEDLHGFIGDFHSGPIIQEIRAAASSGRHLLLSGPSGAGKELAAQAVAHMSFGTSSRKPPFIKYNAARFSSEEEATSTLFGVGRRVFSNVDARPGLIEQAEGGTLFIDEVHNLPERVQRSLLRIIEDGRFSRIGETQERSVTIKFVFASNAPAPTFHLAHDILARLRVLPIPALAERRADIPSIFDHILGKTLAVAKIEPSEVTQFLKADHYEAMCLDGLEQDNVRGLVDIADRIVSYITTGTETRQAVFKVFSERFADGPVAQRYTGGKSAANENNANDGPRDADKKQPHFEQHKAAIIETFLNCGRNLAATEKALNDQGIHCSRRWLTISIDRWGIERRKNTPRS